MQRLLLSLCALLFAGCGGSPVDATPDASAETEVTATAPAASTAADSDSAAWTSDPFPLTTCPVSGEELGSMGDPIVLNQPGREVRLCCQGCVESYEADPAKYNAEIDAAIVALQKPSYPLETCLIGGGVIGASDKMIPVDHVVGNRLYRLCCAACIKSLEKDLPKYREQVLAAAAK